jgi:hypothetical protein
MVFCLAVGLLVGLLVPWNSLNTTKFTYGPWVANTTSSSVTLLLATNRDEARVVYAVVPTYAISTSR